MDFGRSGLIMDFGYPGLITTLDHSSLIVYDEDMVADEGNQENEVKVASGSMIRARVKKLNESFQILV